MSDIRFNQWLHQSGTGGVTQISSGHVGIGTTNPLIPVHSANTATLNVGIITANNIYAGTLNGTLALSNISGITGSFTSDVTINGNLDIVDKIRHIGDTNTAIRFPANDTVSIETSGSEALRIDSNGFLGISTASVSAPFHAFNATNNTIARLESGDATCRLQLKDSAGEVYVVASGDNLILANTSSITERARIDSSGHFGIGMTPSGVRLDVYSTVNDIARFSGANSGGITIRNDTANELQLHTGTSDALIFGTNGENERLRITSDGRIGINDSTPNDYEVDIMKRSTATDAVIRLYNNATGSNNDTIMRYSIAGTSASNYIYFGDGDDSNAGQIRYQHSNDSMQFTAAASERLRITSDGKLALNYAATPPSEDFMICTAGQASPAGLTLSHLSGGNRYGARLQSISGTNRGIVISELFNSSYSDLAKVNTEFGLKADNTCKTWLCYRSEAGNEGIIDDFNVATVTDEGTGSFGVNLDRNIHRHGNGWSQSIVFGCYNDGSRQLIAGVGYAPSHGSNNPWWDVEDNYARVNTQRSTDGVKVDAKVFNMAMFGDTGDLNPT